MFVTSSKQNMGAFRLLPIIALWGCFESSIQDMPTSAAPSQNASQTSHTSVWTIDDEWAKIASELLPGFGGYYTDSTGATVIQASNLEKRAEAIEYVLEQFNAARKPTPNVRFHEVPYNFAQLKNWRDSSMELMKRVDVASLDIDERANKLKFGVLNEKALVEISRALSQRAIPEDAFEVFLRPSITLKKQTLSSYVPNSKDIRGGILITAYANDPCSLGFNAVVPALSWNHLFVTAAHCSSTRFAIDGEDTFQPYYGATPNYQWLGVEIVDPPAPGCYVPGSALPSCRKSDAAIHEYPDDTAGTTGYIARPYGPPGIGGTGSTSIDTTTPSWRIIYKGVHTAINTGDYLNKSGKTTGWTRGYVTSTCVIENSTLNGVTVSLLCQYEAQIYSLGGDSGSPIFHDESNNQYPAGTDVFLFGILWGGYGPFNSIISMVDMMELDFGVTLKVCPQIGFTC